MYIRFAKEEDAFDLWRIYTPYVSSTAVTFEIEIPTLEEFTERIRTISSKYPFLVLEEHGEIRGYAYANTFKGRAAYNHCVEMTVYVRHDCREMGYGSELYTQLEDILARRGILNAYACIATTDNEDKHLSNDSFHFHKAMGYKLCGTFTKCGRKFDTWYNMVWMEKFLGEHN